MSLWAYIHRICRLIPMATLSTVVTAFQFHGGRELWKPWCMGLDIQQFILWDCGELGDSQPVPKTFLCGNASTETSPSLVTYKIAYPPDIFSLNLINTFPLSRSVSRQPLVVHLLNTAAYGFLLGFAFHMLWNCWDMLSPSSIQCLGKSHAKCWTVLLLSVCSIGRWKRWLDVGYGMRGSHVNTGKEWMRGRANVDWGVVCWDWILVAMETEHRLGRFCWLYTLRNL